MICETNGCGEDAEFEDEMGNHLCSDCMEFEIEYSGAEPENFMSIP